MNSTLRVFCAGAVKSAIMRFAQEFERDTNESLQFTFGTVGSLQAKLMAGEPSEIAILTRPALEKMATDKKVITETIIDLGCVGVGIAVRQGAALPDVSTPDALRTVLIETESLTYGDPAKGDSSGIHFAHVIEQLGIAQTVNAKTVLAPVGLAVADMVAKGEVQLGATQASVILARQGVELAGLLPESLQHITTYSAAVMTQAASCDAARRFITYLSNPSAKSQFALAGFKPQTYLEE